MPTASATELDTLRRRIRAATHRDEAACIAELAPRAAAVLTAERRRCALERAVALVERCREASGRAGTLDALFQEFGLANREGIALMRLAEALLRVPDGDTADRLIAEAIHSGDWHAHAGKSRSGIVNILVWSLTLTEGLVIPAQSAREQPDAWARRLVRRVGGPVVRRALLHAMRIMSSQYALGRTIDEALERSSGVAARFSFDMLGEGARTFADVGPVLHVIRYRSTELGAVLGEIRATGYGLTLGVQSRIDGFARTVFEHTRVGNTYVNRNMVGAVVGVNPFGGQGLSGTGPKAGGPNYLLRFAVERTRTENVAAKGGNAELFGLGE